MRYLYYLIFILPLYSFANEVVEIIEYNSEDEVELPEIIANEDEVEITLIKKGKHTIQEFRRKGKLYQVKVIPDVGPAYYFIDPDGDGNMEVRESDLERGIHINQWNLLEWN